VLERRKAVLVAEASAALVRFGAALIDAYAAHKRAHAVLDYEDLVLAARELLERSGGAAWVLYKLDGGIDHVLIDEAQDTSPDQWAVVEALAAEFYAGAGAHTGARTVFAVGDAKQSIFSFQGADPDSFERMRAHFRSSARDAAQRWEEVELDVSFRSADAVLLAVDAVFAQDAAKDGVVAPGQALRHRAAREGQAGQVELWPPVVPDERDEDAPWAPPLEYRHEKTPEVRLARAIARRIKGWIAAGEILASKNRPIRAGDVMVLVSRRTAFVDALVRSLKALSVPVAGVDRMVLSAQAAIEDLAALGRFLLLPEDDLTLAAVLKGPLYGFDDDVLFALAHGRTGTLWAELRRRAGERPEFVRAHAELAALLARADYVAPYELYAELLGARGGRSRILARLGRDARDPIDEFLALALAFESAHPPSLQGFLQWLETGAVEVKRDLEHGLRDEVRILTVHGAKGLQAPIVFLPDTFHTPRATDPVLWLGGKALLWPPRRGAEDAVSRAAREAASAARDRERRRLLYVAMTRAEDRLYVCGWQTRNKPDSDCWYNLIAAAMPGLGAPCDFDFTKDIGEDGWAGSGWRLETGQRAPPETAEDDRTSLPEPERDLPDWAHRAPPAEPPPRPLQPSRPDEDEPAVRAPAGDGAAAFRRGILVHRLLQLLPEIDPARRRDAALRYLALPSHRLDPAAREAIVAEVLRVLADPRFAAVFRPGARAEVALAGEVAGRIVSGQVDRLHVGADAVLVVDYKSNRAPPEAVEHTPRLYLRQLAAYRSVLERIYPGKSIYCALLWTAVPRLVAIPEELLAASRFD
jgi:ATP-dependent helicase/nuclease subunit A